MIAPSNRKSHEKPATRSCLPNRPDPEFDAGMQRVRLHSRLSRKQIFDFLQAHAMLAALLTVTLVPIKTIQFHKTIQTYIQMSIQTQNGQSVT